MRRDRTFMVLLLVYRRRPRQRHMRPRPESMHAAAARAARLRFIIPCRGRGMSAGLDPCTLVYKTVNYCALLTATGACNFLEN